MAQKVKVQCWGPVWSEKVGCWVSSRSGWLLELLTELKIISPQIYIWSNFVQYLRIHLPWKTDINPNSIRGKSFSCSIDSQLCFTGFQKEYRKNGAKEIIYPLSSCLLSIFVSIWKKLKFVEWFSWCNTPCLWEESKFFSLFKNRIFNSRKHSALRVSFICCMRWPTVAHWLARDGWFAETAGVLLPKPPGQWIQILYTYEYKTSKYFPNPGSDGIPVPDPSRTFFQVPDPSRPENWKWLGTG